MASLTGSWPYPSQAPLGPCRIIPCPIHYSIVFPIQLQMSQAMKHPSFSLKDYFTLCKSHSSHCQQISIQPYSTSLNNSCSLSVFASFRPLCTVCMSPLIAVWPTYTSSCFAPFLISQFLQPLNHCSRLFLYF